MKETKTKICKYCKSEIDAKAKICPNCRKKQGGKLKWIIIAIVVLAILGSLFGGGDDDSSSSSSNSTKTTTQASTQTSKSTKKATTQASKSTKKATTQAPKATTEAATTEKKVSAEYLAALGKAESYSKSMHMSKQGIYDQLTSEYGEQFNEDAAKYAIEHLDADWNENALAKAKEYRKWICLQMQSTTSLHLTMAKNLLRKRQITQYSILMIKCRGFY